MIGTSITLKIMLGTAILGATAGVVGSFAVLRKRSLVSDMLAHASLPGICVAFMIMGTRDMLGLSLGAFLSGLLGIGVLTLIGRWTRTKEDAAIGIVLSSFFGIGIVLMSLIQRQGSGHQAGLNSYLFGEIVSIQVADIKLLSYIGLGLLVLLFLIFKELQLFCFDQGYASSLGWPVTILDIIMMASLAVVTIVGLPICGVVLMAAVTIFPATTARFWTNRLQSLLLLAGILGAAAGIIGTFLASPLPVQWLGFDPLAFGYNRSSLPPGPLIVLTSAAFFLCSMFFAPKTGLLARVWSETTLRLKILHDHMLRSLYELSEETLPERPAIGISTLRSHRAVNKFAFKWWLKRAQTRGWIHLNHETVQLTTFGLTAAAEVTKTHGLWEIFLVEHADIASDHVDRDADDVEHVLPKELLAELESRLAAEGRLPTIIEKVPKSLHHVSK